MSSSIKISLQSFNEFIDKINEIMLSPPSWMEPIAISMLGTYRDGLTEIMPYSVSGPESGSGSDSESESEVYKPSYTSDRLNLNFNCTYNNYNLLIQKKNTYENKDSSTSFINIPQKDYTKLTTVPKNSPETEIIHNGLITNDTISKFPTNLQDHAQKYANSEFPYTAEIDNRGNVTVGGNFTFTGRKLNLSDMVDLLKLSSK
jgi:hypothetical protein